MRNGRMLFKNNEKEYLRLSKAEVLNLILKSSLVIVLLDITFYKNLVFIFPLMIVGYAYFKKSERELVGQKRSVFCKQFKDFLNLTVTSLKAGYSVDNAIVNTYADLCNTYGPESDICKVVKRLSIARKNGQNMGDIFIKTGKITGVDDVMRFGQIYMLSYTGSGNVAGIMDKTASTISEKLDIQSQIEATLNERIFEMRIMSIMPFGIVGYISLINRGYFEALYHNLLGIILMTICMLIYIAAYVWGTKIVEIQV